MFQAEMMRAVTNPQIGSVRTLRVFSFSLQRRQSVGGTASESIVLSILKNAAICAAELMRSFMRSANNARGRV